MKTVDRQTGDYGIGVYEDAGTHRPPASRHPDIKSEIVRIKLYLAEAFKKAHAEGVIVPQRVWLVRRHLVDLTQQYKASPHRWLS